MSGSGKNLGRRSSAPNLMKKSLSRRGSVGSDGRGGAPQAPGDSGEDDGEEPQQMGVTASNLKHLDAMERSGAGSRPGISPMLERFNSTKYPAPEPLSRLSMDEDMDDAPLTKFLGGMEDESDSEDDEDGRRADPAAMSTVVRRSMSYLKESSWGSTGMNNHETDSETSDNGESAWGGGGSSAAPRPSRPSSVGSRVWGALESQAEKDQVKSARLEHVVSIKKPEETWNVGPKEYRHPLLGNVAAQELSMRPHPKTREERLSKDNFAEDEAAPEPAPDEGVFDIGQHFQDLIMANSLDRPSDAEGPAASGASVAPGSSAPEPEPSNPGTQQQQLPPAAPAPAPAPAASPATARGRGGMSMLAGGLGSLMGGTVGAVAGGARILTRVAAGGGKAGGSPPPLQGELPPVASHPAAPGEEGAPRERGTASAELPNIRDLGDLGSSWAPPGGEARGTRSMDIPAALGGGGAAPLPPPGVPVNPQVGALAPGWLGRQSSVKKPTKPEPARKAQGEALFRLAEEDDKSESAKSFPSDNQNGQAVEGFIWEDEPAPEGLRRSSAELQKLTGNPKNGNKPRRGMERLHRGAPSFSEAGDSHRKHTITVLQLTADKVAPASPIQKITNMFKRAKSAEFVRPASSADAPLGNGRRSSGRGHQLRGKSLDLMIPSGAADGHTSPNASGNGRPSRRSFGDMLGAALRGSSAMSLRGMHGGETTKRSKSFAVARRGRKGGLKSILKKPGGGDDDEEEKKRRAHKLGAKFVERRVTFQRSKNVETKVFFCIPVMYPGCKFLKVWELFMVAPLAYETFAFSYRFALGEPGWNKQLWADMTCDFLCLVDVFTCFCTAVEKSNGRWVTDGKLIAHHVARHIAPRRIFLPTIMYFFMSAPIGLWWLASVLRLGRTVRLIKYFWVQTLNLEVSVKRLKFFQFVLLLFLGSHTGGCLFFFLARLRDFRDDTWAARASFVDLDGIKNFDVATASPSEKYALIQFKGVITLTNIGWLSSPANSDERIFSIFAIFVQVVLASYVLGTLFHYLVAQDAALEDYRIRVAMVARFSEDRRLPQHLRRRLMSYIEFHYIKASKNYGGGITLPRSLQLRVARGQYFSVLEKCMVGPRAPFKGVSEQFLNVMLDRLHETWLMPGEEFIKQFDSSRLLGFIVKGMLDVLDGNTVIKTIRSDVDGMPTIVGKVGFFVGTLQPYRTSVRKTGDALVLVMHRNEYNDLMESYPEQHDIIVTNILAEYGLDLHGKDLPSYVVDGDGAEEKESERREAIRSVVLRGREDLFNAAAYAAVMGDVDGVTRLLKKGFDLNATNYDGRSILSMAASEGNFKVVELLLDEGADKDQVDRWGQTPLHQAVNARQNQVVDLLQRLGSSIRLDNPSYVLSAAILKGSIETLMRLIDNGVDPNVRNFDRRTPLHLAAAIGAQKCVEYLLNKDADPNAKDRWGWTPLDDAVSNMHEVVVHLLRAAGGGLSGPGKSELSAPGGRRLIRAARVGDVRQLRLLVETGVSIDAGNYDSITSLHITAQEGHLLATSYLISAHANANVQDRWGATPLDSAIRGENWECATLIKAAGGEARFENAECPELASLDIAQVRLDIADMVKQRLDKLPPESVSLELHRARTRALGLTLKLNGKLNKEMDDLCNICGNATKKVVQMCQGGTLWGGLQLLAAQSGGMAAKSESSNKKMTKSSSGVHVSDWRTKYLRVKAKVGAGASRQYYSFASRVLSMRTKKKRVEEELYRAADDVLNAMNDNWGEGDGTGSMHSRSRHKPSTQRSMVAMQARRFQRVVCQQLYKLQSAFDLFAVEFETITISAGGRWGYMELGTLLARLGVYPTDAQLHDIIEQGKVEAQIPPIQKAALLEDEGCVTINGLWSHSPSFRKLFLEDAESTDRCWAGIVNVPHDRMITREEASVRRELMADALEIMRRAYEIVSEDTGQVTLVDLEMLGNNVGEMGAPLVRALFLDDVLAHDSVVLVTRPMFFECFVNFLQGEMRVSGSRRESRVSLDTADENAGGDKETQKKSLTYRVLRKLRVHKARRGLRVLRQVQFFPDLVDPSLEERYKHAFIEATGGTSTALRRQKTSDFLKRVFPGLQLVEKNAGRFWAKFDRNGDGNVTFKEMTAHLRREGEAREERKHRRRSLAISARIRDHFQGAYLHPEGKFIRMWDLLLFVCYLTNLVFIPMRIAFDGMHFGPLQDFSDVMKVVVDVVFILDLIVNCFKAYLNSSSILVTDLKSIYKHYVSTSGPLDAIAAFPLDLLALGSSMKTRNVLRLNKLTRLRMLYLLYRRQQKNAEGHSMYTELRNLFVVNLAVAHFGACIHFSVYSHADNEWWDRAELAGVQSDHEVWGVYLLSIYYVIATTSANGLVGTLMPRTFQEIIMAEVLLFINISLYAYILGQISNLVMQSDNKIAEDRKRQARLDNFIRSKPGIDYQLEQDIRAHYRLMNNDGDEGDLEQVYGLLSFSLKVGVAKHISRDLLDTVDLFQGCTAPFLDSLSVLLTETTFAPNEFIFRTNEVANEMYFVLSGTIEKHIDYGEDESILDGFAKAGSSIGELSFFFGMRHLMTCKTSATTSAVMFKLSKRPFLELLRLYPKEEEIIARNALRHYDDHNQKTARTMSGASSANSGMSEKESVDTIENHLASIVNSTVEAAISSLRKRRKSEQLEVALHAARMGNLNVLNYQLHNGLSVNSVNNDQRTILHIGASEGQLDVVHALLYQGADVSARDRYGNTPLNDAVTHKNDFVAAALRDHGASLRRREEAGDLLCQAAATADVVSMKRYIAAGFDLHAVNADKRSALHVAASEGHVEVVKFLLSNPQVDVNCKDRWGRTPLEDAMANKQVGVQELLRKSGSELGGLMLAGKVCEAAAKGDLPQIRTLLENGVDPNIADPEGRTALHLAACHDRIDVLYYLLRFDRSHYRIEAVGEESGPIAKTEAGVVPAAADLPRQRTERVGMMRRALSGLLPELALDSPGKERAGVSRMQNDSFLSDAGNLTSRPVALEGSDGEVEAEGETGLRRPGQSHDNGGAAVADVDALSTASTGFNSDLGGRGGGEEGVDTAAAQRAIMVAEKLGAAAARVEESVQGDAQASAADVDLTERLSIRVNPVDKKGGTPLDDAVRHGNHVAAALLQRHGGRRGRDDTLAGRMDRIVADRAKREMANDREQAILEVASSAEALQLNTIRKRRKNLMRLGEWEQLIDKLDDVISAPAFAATVAEMRERADDEADAERRKKTGTSAEEIIKPKTETDLSGVLEARAVSVRLLEFVAHAELTMKPLSAIRSKLGPSKRLRVEVRQLQDELETMRELMECIVELLQ